MTATRPLIRRVLPPESGFSLVEVILAMALLAMGILGVGVALTAQSGGLSFGSSFGLAAITRGNYLSTATMLAQGKLEEIKNAQYTASVDEITQANFPNEAYGAIASYPGFRRAVTIQNGAPSVGLKTTTVQVFFRPPRESGLGQEEGVQLVTIIARRP